MNRLARWRMEQGLSQEALAEKLGITQSQASRLLSGKRKPGRRVAVAIELLTKGLIPAGSWDAPSRRSAARAISTR